MNSFEYLMSDFVQRVSHEPTNAGCWNWNGVRFNSGYGRFSYFAKSWLAHRIAYQLFVEAIPDGLEIDHLCRNKACVNPSHMEVVTSRVNTLRSNGAAAINARKTHCKRGHLLEGNNIYVYNTRRVCAVCNNAQGSAYYRAHKERARQLQRIWRLKKKLVVNNADIVKNTFKTADKMQVKTGGGNNTQ